jgi:hypothetical protein
VSNQNAYGNETHQKHHHALGRHHRDVKVIHTPGAVNDVQAGNSFSAQLPVMQEATQKIGSVGDEFARSAESALPHLPHQVSAGTGPIGVLLGHRFNHLFSAHGGLRHAITTHINELGKATSLLSNTTQGYAAADEGSAAVMK